MSEATCGSEKSKVPKSFLLIPATLALAECRPSKALPVWARRNALLAKVKVGVCKYQEQQPRNNSTLPLQKDSLWKTTPISA